MPLARFAALIAALLCLAAAPRAPAGDAPVIAAASNLQFALEDIAGEFTAETGQALRLAFGSSGNFARQIRAGAPFEMFLAADERFVLDLARDGFARDEGAVYAEGRIVMIVPRGGRLAADGTLGSLRDALARGEIARFAIANPEHAPYGMLARDALRHAGLWDQIAPRLVLGENVSQAAQFAVSGNAEGGIVALSLALSPELAAASEHALIPAEWHARLRQRMVLLEGASPGAEAFFRFMSGPRARAILARHGFGLPEG